MGLGKTCPIFLFRKDGINTVSADVTNWNGKNITCSKIRRTSLLLKKKGPS